MVATLPVQARRRWCLVSVAWQSARKGGVGEVAEVAAVGEEAIVVEQSDVGIWDQSRDQMHAE